MHANKISDFYDNLCKKSKNEIKEIDSLINKLYVTNQITLEQKRQIYSAFERMQKYVIKTGKKIILEAEKEFVKDTLKEKNLIKKFKSFKVDFRYKKGMLEKCLERLGEDKSIEFLIFVYKILHKIIEKVSEQYQLDAIKEFRDILFLSIHYYDKRLFTSRNLMNEMKDFSEKVELIYSIL
ncbi:DUF643 domain-containing protein [Borreliella bavariensis]|uniref:DUF643 domain-containing protein n=1 Tax=Borreliella bavariensis TaxID=664662 RepID=UPI001C008EBF|nr:DUF643 domain-containing protein [Borreliella bavariensis]